MTSDVAIVRELAIDEGHVLKSFEKFKAAITIVRPTIWVVPRNQQSLPSNLRTKMRNKL